ncbi:hypothetical protein P4N68_12625 [Corynebacterium felinum]|uniref:Cobalamin biosynthesis Mg chelatase CobN n=1 Tax=Corynebacterium felinum TaxID=131318 RepID=A0ABU2BDJ1_9CORY|nr:hypothetical protein [Corynebacterium felinum]MDF5821912.1 hypothetical protein [Corynebacterium felinum]MDR7355798.1 cobalamin biosynthesis Mg chelatase CobN [Corynebacterium felinum]WJY95144.1 hypothetical protein CFELI_07650 [Corynebacterium felinum]
MKNITLKASLAAVTAVSVALGTVTVPAIATESTTTPSVTAAATTTTTKPANESATPSTTSTSSAPTSEPEKPASGSSIDRSTILTIINFLTGGKFSTILGLSKDSGEDEDTPQTPMQEATAWIKIIGSVLTALAGVIGLIGAAQGLRR